MHVTGRVLGTIVQSCIVTGEPVREHIDEIVDERFGPPGETPDTVDLSLGEDEPPEPIIDNMIDLGEIAAQYLGIAINPFPKAPGAEIPQRFRGEAGDGQQARRNPFEALAALKKHGE